MRFLYVPESPVVNLVDALSPFVLRLDHRAVAFVEKAFVTISLPASELGKDLVEPDAHLEPQHHLWQSLMRVFDDENRRLAEGRKRVRRFSDQYFAQVAGRARTEILLNQLAAEADSFWQRWGDARAVNRHLDFETYLERHNQRETDIAARVRVALLAAEILCADMLQRANPKDRTKIALRLLGDIGADALHDVAASRDFPDLAWLAARAAAPLLTELMASGAAPAQWVALLLRTSGSPQTWSWHRRTALEIVAHEPESGRELLFNRLERVEDDRDNWHVRARCASLLVQIHPGEDTWNGLQAIVGEELVDGVLFELCDALGEQDAAPAVELLHRLGLEPFVPKVRACAARGLAVIAARGLDGAAAAAESLARLIDAEHNDTALRIMTARMEWVLSQGGSGESALQAKRTLRDALAPRLAVEEDAALANALSEFRQAMVRQEVDALTTQFEALGFGDSMRVPRSVAEADLGIAMVLAARDGYGLYARRRFGAWRVRRGEHFRTRLWRVLHELRNPAPNKRQGYRHTRARIFSGPVRAHPTHLGELTPTTVPGERKQVGAEGGWGNYLPHVDDILDAQLSGEPIRIFTSVGVTQIQAPRTALARSRNYLSVSWNYASLDGMRQASILGGDAQERGRFLAFVEQELKTTITFRAFFEDDPVPPHVRSLIGSTAAAKPLEAMRGQPKLLESAQIVPVLAAGFAERVGQFINSSEQIASRASSALFERSGVRIQDLGFVIVGLFIYFLGRMVWARHTIDKARQGIPLSVGGWGTRGKSGTERLKAGMFHGMGYDVFVKTTGCEAMYIHAPRAAEAREIFLYRPYDKASIWEQRDMLQMGHRMRSDVFLWECMALNPRYVEILQAGWMRDDIVTLTNAYPDHEDIQGPAGVDVASTIGRFLPRNLTAITAEREMLPVFQDMSREKNTNLIVVGEEDEFLIPDASLKRFPYNEHPRNISLVARLAFELGIEPEFATFMMADKVVPDLGVLKVYPEVNVRGRLLKFINGCSANERAGFMNNWVRMDLNQSSPRVDPSRRVATVVNNRGDRVSRSVVFADILVKDVAVDRHILIGTNLSGLRIYFEESLDRYLANVAIIDEGAVDADQARRRLTDFLARVRIFDCDEVALTQELVGMVQMLPTDWEPEDDFVSSLTAAMKGWVDGFRDYQTLRNGLPEDVFMQSLQERLGSTAVEIPEAEVVLHDLAHCTPADVVTHWAERLACVISARGAMNALQAFIKEPGDIASFHKSIYAIWRQRFWHTVHSIDDPEISGDGIILEAARIMPPGCHIDLMGTQNIKGTGLDFVYRWVDLNTTVVRVDRLVEADEQAFADELLWLSSASQFGLTEALYAWRALGELKQTRKVSPREVGLIDRARAHLAQLAQQKLADAAPSDNADDEQSRWLPLLVAMEKWLDSLDAVSRRYRSEAFMRDLAKGRISHARMSYEMQKLTKRQKGGWFVSKFRT